MNKLLSIDEFWQRQENFLFKKISVNFEDLSYVWKYIFMLLYDKYQNFIDNIQLEIIGDKSNVLKLGENHRLSNKYFVRQTENFFDCVPSKWSSDKNYNVDDVVYVHSHFEKIFFRCIKEANVDVPIDDRILLYDTKNKLETLIANKMFHLYKCRICMTMLSICFAILLLCISVWMIQSGFGFVYVWSFVVSCVEFAIFRKLEVAQNSMIYIKVASLMKTYSMFKYDLDIVSLVQQLSFAH